MQLWLRLPSHMTVTAAEAFHPGVVVDKRIGGDFSPSSFPSSSSSSLSPSLIPRMGGGISWLFLTFIFVVRVRSLKLRSRSLLQIKSWSFQSMNLKVPRWFSSRKNEFNLSWGLERQFWLTYIRSEFLFLWHIPLEVLEGAGEAFEAC